MKEHLAAQAPEEMRDMSVMLFGPESFLNLDYGFFYNVRENAKLRARTWLEAH